MKKIASIMTAVIAMLSPQLGVAQTTIASPHFNVVVPIALKNLPAEATTYELFCLLTLTKPANRPTQEPYSAKQLFWAKGGIPPEAHTIAGWTFDQVIRVSFRVGTKVVTSSTSSFYDDVIVREWLDAPARVNCNARIYSSVTDIVAGPPSSSVVQWPNGHNDPAQFPYEGTMSKFPIEPGEFSIYLTSVSP